MSVETRADAERDEGLSRLYRSAARDEPPTALDAAMRAVAHRAVGAAPRAVGARPGRWHVPVSVAAVVMLSATLVIMMREEAPELTESPQTQLPALPAPPDRAPTGSPRSPAQDADSVAPTPAEQKNLGPRQQREPARAGPGSSEPQATVQGSGSSGAPRAERRNGPPETPPVPAPARPEAFPSGSGAPGTAAAVSPQRQSDEEARQRDRRDPAFAEPPRAERDATPRLAELAKAPTSPPAEAEASATPKAEAAGASAREKESPLAQAEPKSAAKAASRMARAPAAAAATLPPEKWLDQIEALRKQGRGDEARASLAEFRRRYPDYPLRDSLRDLAQP